MEYFIKEKVANGESIEVSKTAMLSQNKGIPTWSLMNFNVGRMNSTSWMNNGRNCCSQITVGGPGPRGHLL